MSNSTHPASSSSDSPSHSNSISSNNYPAHQKPQPQPQPQPHARRPSIFSSILSLGNTPTQAPASPATSIGSSSLFSSHAHVHNHSPTSSLDNSSPPQKGLDEAYTLSPRRASVSGFGTLTNGFRWPASSTSPTSATAPGVAPIGIPNASAPINSITPSGSSVPTRRGSSGATAFRRPFELPNYSRVFDEAVEEDGAPPGPQRGRSGSLFSSFGSHQPSAPAGAGTQRPKRKLSPMGERMIRDHPF